MKLLTDYLEFTGMTQTELARRMGVDTSVLNNLIKGRRKAGPATFLKIHKAIGIPIDRIVEAAAQQYGAE